MPSNALDLDAINALANAELSRLNALIDVFEDASEEAGRDSYWHDHASISHKEYAATIERQMAARAQLDAFARTLVPQLVARVRELEADAKRYQWCKAQVGGEYALARLAWRVKAACAFDTADDAIDAAMAGEEG